jgi:hypothetical protein
MTADDDQVSPDSRGVYHSSELEFTGCAGMVGWRVIEHRIASAKRGRVASQGVTRYL